MYDFDTILNPDAQAAVEGRNPGYIVRMGVADMDFRSPPEVTEALIARARKGWYGYQGMTEDDYDAVRTWSAEHNGQEIPREHLLATPGVLYTMRACMYALTEQGDRVVIAPPLHTPSIRTAELKGRIPVRAQMRRLPDGSYTLDLDMLEKCFREGARVLLLCSPNNPTGRVLTYDELAGIAELSTRYGVRVVSDEIHRDIVYPPHRHIPLATLPGMEEAVTVFSPSKTFNMGGCHIGSAVISDAELRERVREELYAYGHSCGRPDLFAITAQTAAYRKGAAWLGELLTYLEGNIGTALEMLDGLPLRAVRPEGTMLLWVDCEALGMDTAAFWEFMKNRAHIQVDPGHYYDTADIGSYTGPQHHFRMKLAMPRRLLRYALGNLREAVSAL